MSRLMATTIALPSIAARRFSQCSTMNAARALGALLGADERLQRYADTVLRPFPAAVGVGDVLNLFLGDARALLVHLQFDDAGFVVERPGGTVLDGLADVVDVRVVAEDVHRVSVVALQRRCR